LLSLVLSINLPLSVVKWLRIAENCVYKLQKYTQTATFCRRRLRRQSFSLSCGAC